MSAERLSLNNQLIANEIDKEAQSELDQMCTCCIDPIA